MAADMNQIAAIHRVELEIEETKSKIKTVREDRKDQLLELPEYKGLQILEEKVKEARAIVKASVEADSTLSRTNSELEELKFKLKDLVEILSHHLVVYFQDTGRETIKDANEDNRLIELKAKYGESAPPETEKLPFEEIEETGASVEITQTVGGKTTIIKEGKK